MLCCAVLCCAVLCCAVLCCAVLCCAVLCCAVLCCAVMCVARGTTVLGGGRQYICIHGRADCFAVLHWFGACLVSNLVLV